MESKRKRAPSAESASFVPHTAHEQKKNTECVLHDNFMSHRKMIIE